MSAIQINLVVGSAFLFFGYLAGRCVELFGKGGLLDLRRKLKASEEENARLSGLLIESAFAEFSSEGAGEDGRTSVEQSSARPSSPADELRKAVQVTRDEWDNDVSARMWSAPTRIHLALAELLEYVADDMAAAGAIEETKQIVVDDSVYTIVAGRSFDGFRIMRDHWNPALKCARAITGGSDR
jgi:hypothetical protein